MAFSANVNFQPATAPVPAGYVADSGKVYGPRGNGLTYGWNAANNNNVDRNSARSPDQRYDTFNYLQAPNAGTTWELAVPSGSYSVKAVAGDPNVFGTHNIIAENVLTVNARTSSTSYWATGTRTVNVTDGRLTIRAAAGASTAKINFVEVRQLTVSPPPASPPPAVPPPPPPPAGAIVADLMNSTTDTVIARMTDGYVIDMGQVGTKLNIRATPAGAAGSIVFKLDGASVRTETYAPYGIGGDAGGNDFLDWTPPTGTHTVQILQYSAAGGGGSVVASNTFSFTAVAPGSPPTVPPTVPPSPPTSPPPAPPPPPGPVGGPRVELMDATTNGLIRPLADGETIDMNQLGTKLNLRAVPDGPAARVVFRLNGAVVRTDGSAPYSVSADGVDDYLDWAPPTGPFTLQVDHYDWPAGGGEVLVGTTTLGLTGVGPASPPPVPPPPPPPTTGPAVDLYNSVTDTKIATLTDGYVIDMAAVGTKLNIAAFPAGPVGSVVFKLDGAVARTETYAPYGIGGDAGGNNYLDWTPPVGQHALEVLQYSQPGGQGTVVAATALAFTVLPAPAEPPPPPAGTAFPTSISWTTAAANPLRRGEAAGAMVNGKLYVIGGYDGTVEPGTRNHWIAVPRGDAYDPATNRWTRIADMPDPVSHTTPVVVGNVIWFVGGYDGNHPGPSTTMVWKYDTAANRWSRGPDLPAPRGGGGAALIGNTIYYATGMEATRTENRNDVWALDVDNQQAGWVRRASIPTGRNHTGVVAMNGKLYVVGGQLYQEEATIGLDAFEEYDPATDTWTARRRIPVLRSHLTSSVFVYRGRVCIAGGDPNHDHPQREVFAWDPATDTWSIMGYLPAPRGMVVAGVLPDGRIIAATGGGPGPTDNVWIGTPR